ncbi:MAG TPA: hypothetical protein VGC21_21585 [Telluria sp.]|jgi:hypothetical protein
MDLHAQALDLFLAESSAISLVGEIDAQIGFGSSLHKRHKIRKSDINTVFEAADKTSADSEQRAIMVAVLLVFSGAAYAAPQQLVAAPILKNAQVTPHWNDAALSLHTVVFAEPMNLFPGWGTVNTSLNHVRLDQHWILELSGKALTTSLEQLDDLDTEMFKIGTALAGGRPTFKFPNSGSPSASSSSSSSSAVKPPLVRQLTPHSQFLGEHHGKMDDYFRGASKIGSAEFRKVATLVDDSTSAGTLHYTQLIESLHERKPGTKISRTLEEARDKWAINRALLKQMVELWM